MRFDARLTQLEQAATTQHPGAPLFCKQSDGLFVDVSRCVYDHNASGLDAPPFVRRYTQAEIDAIGQGGK